MSVLMAMCTVFGTARGEPLEWVTSRSVALSRARAEGKNIFLISGRDTCGNTMGTRNYSCEAPSVKRHLSRDYVCWYNVVDTQYGEVYKYFSGYDIGDTLPFIAIIDAATDKTLVAEGGYHPDSALCMMLGRVANEISISPDGAQFTESIKVTLTAKSAGVIYYTLDGTIPDETSLRYEKPITLSKCATICAAVFSGGEFGLPMSASFTRSLTEKNGAYKWTVHVIDDGCMVKSITPAPAGDLVIPASIGGFDVNGFDDYLFIDNQSITSVSIPATLTSFRSWSFSGCWNLKSINVDAANEDLSSENGVVYNKTMEALIACPPGVEYFEIPDRVCSIRDYSCMELRNIKEIFIPDNVESIGAQAFAGCEVLATVVVSERIESIGYDAFSYCPRLADAWLPDHLRYDEMGYDSFYREDAEVALHYYQGVMNTFSVSFEDAAVSRRIPSLDGKALMSVGALPVPTRPHCKFLGWFTEPVGGKRVLASTMVTEDAAFYAHWLNSGSLVMTADTVNGGGRMKVTVSRIGGAEGRVAVKLKTQDASTVGGINGRFGVDFEYLKKVLVWDEGDMSDRVVYVQTYATDSASAATLRLKLSVMTTGDYADCVEPTLASGGKVIATINPAKKGTISFVAPNPMSVRAGEVFKVKIRRTGGSDGRIAVKIKTQDASTVNGINGRFGIDFQYVKETLVWGHGDASDKTVEIPTVAGWWDGPPKTFRLKLSAMTTGEYAGCVAPALASGGKVIASIQPNAAVCPGEVVIKSVASVRNKAIVGNPVTAAPFWGYAGDTLRVTLSRVGGDFGRIAVKIKTQDASTVNGITARFATDFTYVKETLVWNDGETADKVIEIPTFHVGGAAYPRTLRLKLSAMTTGEYEGCATPVLPDPKVIVGLRE